MTEGADRVEFFFAVFNDVHAALRHSVRDRSASFHDALLRYRSRVLGWDDQAEALDRARLLRNLLVHEPRQPGSHSAVPSQGFLEGLERIRDDLRASPEVGTLFARDLVTVEPDDTLARVFALVTQNDFSQFPVYDEGQYLGLLSENGITRWLAHHTHNGEMNATVPAAKVRELIASQESTNIAYFVDPAMTLPELRRVFAEAHVLEAVLITEDGIPSDRLLGIATRWDLLHS